MKKKCKKHPKYTAKRKPRVNDCVTCLQMRNAVLEQENRIMKAWRKEYDAGEVERRWKAQGGSW